MHDAGLRHRFLHPGNLSLSGAILDLDSVEGEILGFGDTPFQDADRGNDMQVLDFVRSNSPPNSAGCFDHVRFTDALFAQYKLERQRTFDVMVSSSFGKYGGLPKVVAPDDRFINRAMALYELHIGGKMSAITRAIAAGSTGPDAHALLGKVIRYLLEQQMPTFPEAAQQCAVKIVKLETGKDVAAEDLSGNVPSEIVHSIAQQFGYHDDVLANAIHIKNLYEAFFKDQDADCIDVNHNLLVQATAWEYVPSFDTPKLLADFDQFQIEEVAERTDAYLKQHSSVAKKQAVDEAIQKYRESFDAFGRFHAYVEDRVRADLANACSGSDAMNDIRARSGEAVFAAMVYWYEQKRIQVFLDESPDEADLEIAVEKRFDGIRARFC